MLEQIHSEEQFAELLSNQKKIMIMKHSSTCPISHAAYEEYEKFASESSKVPVYYLVVQDSRALSNYIADEYGIKHESPQAILFADSKPVWNASHWKITSRALKDAVSIN
ncbi:MAG: bacillithiol system redox-active protein YtxJ [Bacillota bacterium]|nr:bacillithiol system redox-active protein YtxJ [Bacillota bacterium]MDP4168999.1 bacillithiol system redox-active protein YtxJ [Bacillota bacterium]